MANYAEETDAERIRRIMADSVTRPGWRSWTDEDVRPATKLRQFLVDHSVYWIFSLIYGPLVVAIVIDLVQSRGNIVKVLGDLVHALEY